MAHCDGGGGADDEAGNCCGGRGCGDPARGVPHVVQKNSAGPRGFPQAPQYAAGIVIGNGGEIGKAARRACSLLKARNTIATATAIGGTIIDNSSAILKTESEILAGPISVAFSTEDTPNGTFTRRL